MSRVIDQVQTNMSTTMRAPPSLGSYLENMAKPGSAPSDAAQSAAGAAQRELQKFKAMQERRAELMKELHVHIRCKYY
jgi:hypothetical protein